MNQLHAGDQVIYVASDGMVLTGVISERTRTYAHVRFGPPVEATRWTRVEELTWVPARPTYKEAS